MNAEQTIEFLPDDNDSGPTHASGGFPQNDENGAFSSRPPASGEPSPSDDAEASNASTNALSISIAKTVDSSDRLTRAPATAFSPNAAVEGGEGGKVAVEPPPSPPSDAPDAKIVTAAPPVPAADDVYLPVSSDNPVVTALAQAGLYQHEVEGNGHRITCPWASEHAPGERAETFYFAPSEQVPLGTFYCRCTHSKPHRIGALLEHLGVSRQDARCKDLIRVINGELHRVVAASEKVLAKRGGFYRSNGMIVRLKTDPVTGDVAIEPVTEQSLTMHLSAASGWQKFDARSEEWQRRDVPVNVVKALLNSPGTGELPSLNGLSRQPFLRRSDGKLVTTPGYDRASGVFAAFDPAQFNIPLLTKENALKALRRMQSLLVEFEFAASNDRAATCCAMLTASIRHYLNVAPGFNITASSPGSGKSYLASVLAPFSGPADARNISYPMTQEEATKVVLSLALEQPAAVCFDDMPTDWLPHGAMNRMLTSGTITERKLGSNTVVTARASSFVMGTGNNIRPLRDMARRVASIYLLPKVETAATRSYDGRPADEVRQRRGRYVSDALTIIAAWRAAGSPKADVPNIAGFEEWSDLCRHSLIWLGEPDPATSLIEQIAHDPDREQLGNLLYAWRDAFGQKATLVRQVLKHIENDKHGDLFDAIMELPCVERGFVNQSRFGRYLARNKNRIVNGLQLVEAPHSERRAWGVVPVARQCDQSSPVVPEDPLKGIESVWLDDMLTRGKTPPAVNSPA